MTEHNENDAVVSVRDQAAEWFIRIRDHDLSAADRRRYVRWLKRSPSHISEFLRLCHMYKGLKRAELPTPLPLDEDASNVIELVPRDGSVSAQKESPPRPRTLRIAAAIGALALASLLGLIVKIAFFSNTIETAESEWRQFELADGSIVRAGPRTLLRFDFDKDRRYVHLPRGEAVFQVAKDPGRPFLVNAEPVMVRAIGTEFGVVRREDKVIVTVAEGKVAVSRGTLDERSEVVAEKVAPVDVTADEQVSVPKEPDAWPVVVQKVSATRELAWARGRLIFESETVKEAIEEFNRRNRLQIQVDDPGIAARPACCVFDAADPESFAEAIAAAPDVALERVSSGVLRLVPEHQVGPRGGSRSTESI